MSISKNDELKDFEYFKLRKVDKLYISKVFPYKTFGGKIPNKARYINKVFEKEEENEFVKVKGEIVLRSSPTGRDQVSVILVEDEKHKKMSFVLQKFRENPKNGLKPITESSFTFRNSEFQALLKFLSDLKFIDFDDKSRFTVDDKVNFDKKIDLWLKPPDESKEINVSYDLQLINALSELKGDGREVLLKSIRNKVLTKEDLDILSGRKEGLEIFKTELFKEKQDWNEPNWQKFFDNNSWIFGYGLDYKFLKIVQKEASVSDSDVDGTNSVISDFLLGNKRFTVLVELKRPDTRLFENSKNRSNSWTLSKDLTNAVSQILTQKAEWEIKSQMEQFDSEGNVINEKTYDPKTILIIGNTSQFIGDDRESKIKAKTFELYRRNSRNIEIITFDELLDKASFIVSNKQKIEKSEIEDELVF
jgi:hypothetical protein